jgi:hypothetical protein
MVSEVLSPLCKVKLTRDLSSVPTEWVLSLCRFVSFELLRKLLVDPVSKAQLWQLAVGSLAAWC